MKSESRRLNALVGVRMTRGEYQVLQRHAASAGLSTSGFVRGVLGDYLDERPQQPADAAYVAPGPCWCSPRAPHTTQPPPGGPAHWIRA